MQSILIDTEVFRRWQYDFGRTELKALASHVREHRVHVLISSVTDREVRSHLIDEFERAETSIRQLFRDNPTLRHIPSTFQALAGVKRPLEGLDDVRLKQWEQLKSDLAAEVISANPIDAEEILDAYFAGKPPFSGIKKKFEFPDALALFPLLKWSTDKHAVVTVVSADGDLKTFCEAHNDKLHHVHDLAVVLERATDASIADAIIEGFESIAGDLKMSLREQFEELEIPYDPYEAEVIERETITFDLSQPRILSAKDGRASAEVELDARCELTISYNDPSTGIWNSEDNELLFQEQGTLKSVNNFSYIISIELNYELDDPTQFTIDSVFWNSDLLDVDIERLLRDDQ